MDTLGSLMGRLRDLASLSRKLGLSTLALTVGNLFLLALLFVIFFGDQRMFKGIIPSKAGFEMVQRAQQTLGFILLTSVTIFFGSLFVLYWFDQTRKNVLVIANEIFDEVKRYGKREAMNTDAKIGLEERIIIKSASENTSLPFLSQTQGVAIYVFINLLLFLAVAVVDLYLVQSLPSLPLY